MKIYIYFILMIWWIWCINIILASDEVSSETFCNEISNKTSRRASKFLNTKARESGLAPPLPITSLQRDPATKNSEKQRRQRERQRQKKFDSEEERRQVKADSSSSDAGHNLLNLPQEFFVSKYDLENHMSKRNWNRAYSTINASPFFKQLIPIYLKNSGKKTLEALLDLGKYCLDQLYPYKALVQHITEKLLELPVKPTLFEALSFYKHAIQKNILNPGHINSIKNQVSATGLDDFFFGLSQQNNPYVNPHNQKQLREAVNYLKNQE
ncbi:hypothetical protein PVAND_009175 [Polypedilum vanderplanki]|uniref:Uncharacterized protein n=1 Tax=Polypedilum vanderplanki TaxID=319348 RepID=A0A9J6CCA8_POLVA|nr:hypothetical protein PVAND_009175 [Polypedilum vanderplanki]